MNIINEMRNMSKKTKIIVLIAILLILAGGIFLWNERREKQGMGFANLENYTVKETSEGKLVEIKDIGLSFNIPEGWRIGIPDYGTQIFFYSPDEKEKNRFLINEGCKIDIEVEQRKVDINKIEEEIDSYTLGYLSANNEIITVDNRQALKSSEELSESLNLYHVMVFVPYNNLFCEDKIYSFGLFSNLKDKERCSQEFDKFLETISIK
ncbi:hypothetical protein KAS79_01675 [Candidatus Parcubacteria bacterium]|nr:hypothetical protein [Candidatus Parcubacteria bacterium]